MQFSPEIKLESPIIIVGGAMRSGTTMLSALLSTSPQANGFLAECRYLTTLIHPLASALEQFEPYSQYYFSSVEELQEYHAFLTLKVLSDMRTHLGNPEMMVLKDPFITRYIPFLVGIHKLIRGAVIFRDYNECVASILRGEEKDGTIINDEQFATICQQYNDFYRQILKNFSSCQGRIILLRYDDVTRGVGLDLLHRLGVDDIDPEKIWQNPITDVSIYKDYKYFSDLYGKPMSAERIGDPRAAFSDERAEIARTICGPTYDALNRLYAAQ